MIGKKTGALLGLSAEMGALLGKLDNHKNKDLFEFGFNLGLAFQIQDDYLEIFGDESSMGKSLGSDITSGKQTVLTILAREKDPVNWERFISSNSDIQGYKEYYESSEVKIEAKKLIDEFILKSQINLDVVPKEKRDALKSFSQLILNRKF